MKLFEIADEHDTPLLVSIIRKRLAAGERVARYYKSGESVKPMWVVKIEKTSDPIDPENWIFTVNKGNNVNYLRYTTAEMNDKMELVPGKTKKTWTVRKIAPPVNEGKGEDILAFSDFLAKRVVKDIASTRKYEGLAAKLFKDGWKWSGADHPDGPHFSQGDKWIYMPRGNKGHWSFRIGDEYDARSMALSFLPRFDVDAQFAEWKSKRRPT